MAAGVPRLGAGGIVQVYARSDSTGTWDTLNSIIPDEPVDDFGASIALSVGAGRVAMAIGAPRTRDTQFINQRFGAAFYYELSGNSWTQQGGKAAPDPNPLTASGEAGAAVAVSAESRRMTVGAPRVSLDLDNINNVSSMKKERTCATIVSLQKHSHVLDHT